MKCLLCLCPSIYSVYQASRGEAKIFYIKTSQSFLIQSLREVPQYRYILNKVEIWKGVTDALGTDSQTLKDSATQLLIKYMSGAIVTQKVQIKEK